MFFQMDSKKDDYQCDIILFDKYCFMPSLSKYILDKLDYLFCVDSCENSKIFASNKRNLCLTNKYRLKYKLEKGYNYNDIRVVLKNQDVVVIRRKVENGLKIDNNYVIDEGKFVDIETFGYGYDNLNILVNINGCIKQYAPHRVYIRNL